MEFFSTIIVNVFTNIITSCVTAMVIVAALFFFINKVKKAYKKVYKRAKEEIFRFFYVPTVLVKKHMREVAENTNQFLRSWRRFVESMIFNLKILLKDSLNSAFCKIDYKGMFLPKVQVQEPVPVVVENEVEEDGFVNIGPVTKDVKNDDEDWLEVDPGDFDVGVFEDFEDIGDIGDIEESEQVEENDNF